MELTSGIWGVHYGILSISFLNGHRGLIVLDNLKFKF